MSFAKRLDGSDSNHENMLNINITFNRENREAAVNHHHHESAGIQVHRNQKHKNCKQKKRVFYFGN